MTSFSTRRLTCFLLPALLSFATCDTTETLAPPPEPEETGLVAFLVYYPDIDTDWPRIAVAPFDQPTNYRFLGGREFALRALFAPDQSSLLFALLDSTTAFQKFFRYDTRLDTVYSMPGLRSADPDRTPEQFAFNIEKKSVTWNDDGTGFYFDTRFGIAETYVTYYYALGDSTAVFLNAQAAPVAFIGPDTLLVQRGGEPLYQLLNLRFGTFTPLTNPHLNTRTTVAWNAERRLFVGSRLEPGSGALRSAQLILTNLDGSFFQELTPMELHRDIDPHWGPNGTVFFNRTPRDSHLQQLCGSIMLVDTETREVREWLRPEAVEGAAHLCQPDY